MQKSFYAFILLVVSVATLSSCRDTETYAEQRDRERAAIGKFIADSAVTVISEKQFKEQGYTTNLNKNEFVLIESNGVYLQIVEQGCGEKIKDGETTPVLCRFSERNLLTDSLQLTNNVLRWAHMYDKMSVTNTSGTFTGSFISGQSLMATAYGSAAVPGGWLTPFSYIKVGRPVTASDEIARVRLIVPASQGQSSASAGVYPCLYDITYERGR